MIHELEQLKTKVLADINTERKRQDKLWGLQRHDYGTWLGILGEEHGEVCQAVNRINFPNDAKETDADNLYEELIHEAAVASAMAEQYLEEKMYKKLPLNELWVECEKQYPTALREWKRRYQDAFPLIGEPFHKEEVQ